MERKHLVKSAEYWFESAKREHERGAALMAMENAYNHVENALAYILNNCPEAKELFDKTQNKS